VARYEVRIKPSARKELEAVGLKKDRQRIVAAILNLADDPRPSGCRKLSGREKYRIRCGDYRIVYSVQDVILVVTIVRVGHRSDVHRRADHGGRNPILAKRGGSGHVNRVCVPKKNSPAAPSASTPTPRALRLLAARGPHREARVGDREGPVNACGLGALR
jgi:mRNA interferase RelE/StbE